MFRVPPNSLLPPVGVVWATDHPSTQHGYKRTRWWFESSGASDVFAKYLADLVASAADRPVKFLEVKKKQKKTEREMNSLFCPPGIFLLVAVLENMEGKDRQVDRQVDSNMRGGAKSLSRRMFLLGPGTCGVHGAMMFEAARAHACQLLLLCIVSLHLTRTHPAVHDEKGRREEEDRVYVCTGCNLQRPIVCDKTMIT